MVENVEYKETDTVNATNNSNCTNNQEFDKDETTAYWNTRRLQRFQANNNNPFINTSTASTISMTVTASTSTPITTLSNSSNYSKTHSVSNINKHDDPDENDYVNHNRTVRRIRHTPNDQPLTVTNDSYIDEDPQCFKSSRVSLNNALNRSNNSSRNQLNHSIKGLFLLIVQINFNFSFPL